MKPETNNEAGTGRTVPPLKFHVMIYFLQKDASESEAGVFYDHFNARKWKSRRNRIISNWKEAAWAWILDLKLKN